MMASEKNYQHDHLQKLQNGRHATHDTEQEIKQRDMYNIFVNVDTHAKHKTQITKHKAKTQ